MHFHNITTPYLRAVINLYVLVLEKVLALDPVIGAIAAGNAVVLKCSEVAPSVSKVLSEIIPKYLDNQAIHVVEGGAPEGEELLKQKWDKIFYTGTVSSMFVLLLGLVDITFKTLCGPYDALKAIQMCSYGKNFMS